MGQDLRWECDLSPIVDNMVTQKQQILEDISDIVDITACGRVGCSGMPSIRLLSHFVLWRSNKPYL